MSAMDHELNRQLPRSGVDTRDPLYLHPSDNAGGSSSHSTTVKPHFFRIISPHSFQHGTLEFPPKFVKEYGNELAKYVSLEAPEGTPHAVEVETSSDGRMWLSQGWLEFVERYSIELYYFLLFRYEGGSAFHVSIYHTGCTEIEYPISDDDDDNDHDVDDEPPPPQNPKMGNKSSKAIKSASMEYDESIARERAAERARAFKSPHPHFISIMQLAYLSKCYLYISECSMSSYFHGRKDNGMKVNGPDGRAWSMKYYTTAGSTQNQVRITSGWNTFVKEYRLQVGDACVFELINDTTVIEFQVTIFRVDDEKQKQGGRRA